MKKVLILIILFLFACDKNDKGDDNKIEIGIENVDANFVDDMSSQLEDSETELEEDLYVVSDKINNSTAGKITDTEYDSVTGYHSKERSWSFSAKDSLEYERNQEVILVKRDFNASGTASVKARFSDAIKHYEFPQNNKDSITEIEITRSIDRSAIGTVTRYVDGELSSTFTSKARDIAANFESVLTRDTEDETVWNMAHTGTRTLEVSIVINDKSFEMNRSMSVEFQNIKVKAYSKKKQVRKRFAIISGQIVRELTLKGGDKLIVVTTYYDCNAPILEKVKKTKYKRDFYKNSISENNLIRTISAYCRD
jgi:hypothetical protein